MREIKFRAWNKYRFLNEYEFAVLPDGGILTYDYEAREWKVSNYLDVVLMQYTGLKDDNGTEIYEGDIIEIQSGTKTKTSYRSLVRIVSEGAMVDGLPVHKSIGMNGDRSLVDFCDYGVGYQFHLKCNVVGNAYENPELLQEVEE